MDNSRIDPWGSDHDTNYDRVSSRFGLDGINLEDTLKKSFTQWFSSSNSEDRIHFLINGLLPNLKNTLNEDEREKVTDHLWKIGTNDGDLENDEEDLYNLVVDILDV